VRSTKHEIDEEFTVDAVEIVSFGSALFYRSLEKPKPFLLPVSDYQIVEGKESRMVLKNAQFDKTIKIGGGKETSFRKEIEEEEEEQSLSLVLEEEEVSEALPVDPSIQRKRERRRNRRRRHLEEKQEASQQTEEKTEPVLKESPAAAVFTHLIPPPPTLISASIQKYKEQQTQEPSVEPAPNLKEPEEHPQKEGEGEANTISRQILEPPPFNREFSTMNDWSHFLS
jgi:hypothetical protein